MTTMDLVRMCIDLGAMQYIARPKEPHTPSNVYCVAGQVCYSLREACKLALDHHETKQKEAKSNE